VVLILNILLLLITINIDIAVLLCSVLMLLIER